MVNGLVGSTRRRPWPRTCGKARKQGGPETLRRPRTRLRVRWVQQGRNEEAAVVGPGHVEAGEAGPDYAKPQPVGERPEEPPEDPEGSQEQVAETGALSEPRGKTKKDFYHKLLKDV